MLLESFRYEKNTSLHAFEQATSGRVRAQTGQRGLVWEHPVPRSHPEVCSRDLFIFPAATSSDGSNGSCALCDCIIVYGPCSCMFVYRVPGNTLLQLREGWERIKSGRGLKKNKDNLPFVGHSSPSASSSSAPGLTTPKKTKINNIYLQLKKKKADRKSVW